MLKNITNLGTTLNKSEQQSINGGDRNCNGGSCATYDYPFGIDVTIEQYLTIPIQFQCCVRVSPF
ncbi:hypothetical protein SAMN04487765_3734 [Tenacibaculum sp. MAR_2010_89]|uniref:hypothetical protein n=1 Tax=Tenacibaculum sp. MAR_2010_89 TaxID=1250198 RepID=UPI00089CFD64|nr:hypothetical protein [Tenacibaculum sp. MAR_2010_89]SEE67367.1 hypothetical protein SAMN04487765_3734 [Tenacibaculum sp. MAR_2010_89]